jgi:hypothetical protein
MRARPAAAPLADWRQVNASDARGKSDASVLKGVGGKLANAVKELTTNCAVSYDKNGKRKKVGGGSVCDLVPKAAFGGGGGCALVCPVPSQRHPLNCCARCACGAAVPDYG